MHSNFVVTTFTSAAQDDSAVTVIHTLPLIVAVRLCRHTVSCCIVSMHCCSLQDATLHSLPCHGLGLGAGVQEERDIHIQYSLLVGTWAYEW